MVGGTHLPLMRDGSGTDADGNVPNWDAGTWLPWDEVASENCGMPSNAFFYDAWKDHPGPISSIVTKGK